MGGSFLDSFKNPNNPTENPSSLPQFKYLENTLNLRKTDAIIIEKNRTDVLICNLENGGMDNARQQRESSAGFISDAF